MKPDETSGSLGRVREAWGSLGKPSGAWGSLGEPVKAWGSLGKPGEPGPRRQQKNKQLGSSRGFAQARRTTTGTAKPLG